MSPSEINTVSWNPQILPICPWLIHEWNRIRMEWSPEHCVLGKGILVKLSSFVPVSPPVIASLELFTASQGENSFESGKKMCSENYSYDDAKGFTRTFSKGHDRWKQKYVNKCVKWAILHNFKEKIFPIGKRGITKCSLATARNKEAKFYNREMGTTRLSSLHEHMKILAFGSCP